jgi:Peptidase M15
MNFILAILKTLFDLVVKEETKPSAPQEPNQEAAFWSLDDKIANTRFTWRQALTQGNTGQYAIPTVEQENMIIKQAKLLEGIWTVIGPFRITSWLRTEEHNRSIGGAPHSVHLVGAATDLIPLKVSVADAKKMVKERNAYPGGTELNSTTWCHYDYIHTQDFFA